ncbi:hypothetical protein [uncultured Campylobacter sp.]|uniref:hypothetical protein n=1 Tax=uncultured Campylobacter sp. TaxID=218934 RepID=UPI002622098F|nr:hypothetical protein [uncultured Campylobacter sp.]
MIILKYKIEFFRYEFSTSFLNLTLKFTSIFTAQIAASKQYRQIYAIKFNKLKFDSPVNPPRLAKKSFANRAKLKFNPAR